MKDFKPGDNVLVIMGALNGLSGTFIRYEGQFNERAVVKIDGKELTFPHWMLEKK